MRLLPFSLPDWPWGGDSVTARLYSNVDWTDVNRVRRLSGEPETEDFYQQFTGTVIGRTILFADGIDTPATLSGLDRQDALVTMVLFDEDGNPRRTVFSRWATSDALNPSTFAELTIFNKRYCRRLRDDLYLTAALTLAAIQAAIDGIVLVNIPTAIGLVEIIDGVGKVDETLITDLSIVLMTAQDDGVSGMPRVSARIEGDSFTVTTSNPGDNGFVGWSITEPV